MLPTLLLTLVACGVDRMEAFRPDITDVPAIVDLGRIGTVAESDWAGAGFDPSANESVIYSQLGAPENIGVYGGATANFLGTGGSVCVVVDPEAVFWNLSVDADAEGGRRYRYLDRFEDDGDLDLSVGLTAYYTGSPGVKIGDFNAVYGDPSGTEHTLAFNECVQVGRFGDINVHAGRATVEFCEIDTSERAGIPYTIVLKSFALPHDDSILSYGLAVFEGSCDGLAPDECTLLDEVTNAEPSRETPVGKEWFVEIESAVCQGVAKVNEACEAGIESYGLDGGPCQDPNP